MCGASNGDANPAEQVVELVGGEEKVGEDKAERELECSVAAEDA